MFQPHEWNSPHGSHPHLIRGLLLSLMPREILMQEIGEKEEACPHHSKQHGIAPREKELSCCSALCVNGWPRSLSTGSVLLCAHFYTAFCSQNHSHTQKNSPNQQTKP